VSRVNVYSRPGCSLCDELLEALLPLVRDRAAVEVRDIDSREDWQRLYATRIPVVEIDDSYVCQHRLDSHAVQRALAAGNDAI
jgi:hypothetical protein